MQKNCNVNDFIHYYNTYSIPTLCIKYLCEDITEELYFEKLYKLIYFTNSKLAIIPVDIDQFYNIMFIDLERNNISIIPLEFCNCSCPNKLYLGWNKISQVPKEIKKLIKLKKIYIYLYVLGAKTVDLSKFSGTVLFL